MDKRMIYSQRDLVNIYEHKRFRGKSGEFVNYKELNLVYKLLINNAVKKTAILDSPCGTGRLTHFLKINGFNVIGLDYSEGMIDQTFKKTSVPVIRADMFHLPLRDRSLNCLVSLRFIFHYSDIQQVFIEARRVLTDGGHLIFDTFNWSPKSNMLFGDKRVYIHSRRKIKYMLEALGMNIVDARHCFFVSPQLYKLLPLRVVKFLELLEGLVPPWLLVRSFWCVRK
jgi:ubiquinone/menaquinone biosynthesis C-methylase UbiE